MRHASMSASAASVTNESLGLSANVVLGALPFPSQVSRRHRRMNYPLPSPQDLQSHLYHAFLDGKTADVALRISGSWRAVYHLHRVILIQSGFFRSLFTAGFVEASPSQFSVPDEIDVVFDDHNITRAAFEICISRLYGGGPPLHVCPLLRPTLSHPLTPGFPYQPKYETPSGHQAATPQFLLSLLATSIYLSIPSLASQALSSICGTLGPYTVISYLNFSLGNCTSSEDAAQGAVGLESVAELLEDHDSDNDESIPPSLSRNDRPNSVRTSFEPVHDGMSFKSHQTSIKSRSQAAPEPVTFHYGAVSDKIGEAAAAWLARWGPDILEYEEKVVEGVLDKDIPPLPSHPKTIRRRAKTLDSAVRTEVVDAASTSVTKPSIPVIWRRGGLSPHWVKALISSDSFFTKDEMGRYDFAKRAVQLRRKQGGIDPDEEIVWKEMFETGIYYANMVPEDIIKISSDICPTTEQPYVALSVLQAANWSQTLLRHDLTFRPASPPTPTFSSVKGKEKDLGVTFTRESFLNGGTKHKDGPFYLVPVDQTLRIGENGGPSSEGKGISMEQLFAHSHSPYSLSSEENLKAKFKSDEASNYPITFDESSFFGLLPNFYTPSSTRDASTDPKAVYSPYPPFRFSVEFWDSDHLKEKQRLHSQTIWYAGSLFNVYIQVVKKKGSTVSGKDQTSQLGIYLCRQSTVEAIPARSAPNPLVVRQSNDEDTASSPSDHSHSAIVSGGRSRVVSSSSATSQPASPMSPGPVTPTRSTTPLSSPATSTSLPSYHTFPDRPGTSGTASSFRDAYGYPYSLPYTLPGTAPSQPYRDPRPSVSAYFMIYCANPTGSSQTRFKSTPDVFKVSQSWGWKSSSLKGEDIPAGDDDPDDEGNIMNHQGSKVSLRATVVLGVV
ncbi:uncharacterized protein EV420DRAFT_901967 [Desarmillaria tabescens]|uniref:BTB domain-containing protein n=1 Tax=Armillaria tabescens TaxID=1929756 RepID=A0AA39JS22_ARMTA|nr:uncharacterized protein EV420DRAFT_901967 [Desarmillaria tabescens]KAK0446424.1 hypothetical protein EV420DRAFT_901967 [Desarmillaria tabescens]